MNLSDISKLSNAKTRSITAENVYGEKGKGGMAEISGEIQPEVAQIGQDWRRSEWAVDLGRGWKVRPCIVLPPEKTTVLMDIDGPGVIQHIWMTFNLKHCRDLILRIYWDNEKKPSVEVPLGDFFCSGTGEKVNIFALPINVNPSNGMNCYFPMPFRKHAKITIENRFPIEVTGFFYAINYALTEIDDNEAYFHAQFRHMAPVPERQDFVILDDVLGKGQFVGCYMTWRQSQKGWWGEGEIKIFLDGDREFPTICGTGTEDYFGGAWGFGENFSAPFLGYPSGKCDGNPGNLHSLYRFHIMDPVRFEKDIRINIQALGWLNRYRYAHLRDTITSTAYWYQTEPHNEKFPMLPDKVSLDDLKFRL